MTDTRPALLAVDMQTGFDAPEWGARNNPAAEGNGLRLLERWRKLGWPVILVRHDSDQPGSPLAPDAPGNEFKPGFAALEGEWVIAKRVNSAFIGTDLEQRLRRARITRLVVFGLTTDQCVSTTVRMAANLGFAVTVIEDACACFALRTFSGGQIDAARLHTAHIATLMAEFAEVIRTEQALLLN